MHLCNDSNTTNNIVFLSLTNKTFRILAPITFKQKTSNFLIFQNEERKKLDQLLWGSLKKGPGGSANEIGRKRWCKECLYAHSNNLGRYEMIAFEYISDRRTIWNRKNVSNIKLTGYTYLYLYSLEAPYIHKPDPWVNKMPTNYFIQDGSVYMWEFRVCFLTNVSSFLLIFLASFLNDFNKKNN